MGLLGFRSPVWRSWQLFRRSSHRCTQCFGTLLTPCLPDGLYLIGKSRRQYIINSRALRLLAERRGVHSEPWAGFSEPALPTPVSVPAAGDQWVHEVKFDGQSMDSD